MDRSWPGDRPALGRPGRTPTTTGLSGSPSTCIRCKDAWIRCGEGRSPRDPYTLAIPPEPDRPAVAVVPRAGGDGARPSRTARPHEPTVHALPRPISADVVAVGVVAAAGAVVEHVGARRRSRITTGRMSGWRCAGEGFARGMRDYGRDRG